MHRGMILCIVHQRMSYPARVGRLFMERGFALDVRCPNIGQALPETLDGYAAVCMFGGPMSAFDDHIPAIPIELRWMDRALAAPQPFLGVCLGAQMLARALGADVYRHPDEHVEIGYTPIRPTQAGRDYFDGPMHVYQWHKDGFDLPCGSELLAAGTESFPNQCFRYGDRAYGVQFHPECTFDMVQRWSKNVVKYEGCPGAMPSEEQVRLHPVHDPAIDAFANRIVDRLVSLADNAGLIDQRCV